MNPSRSLALVAVALAASLASLAGAEAPPADKGPAAPPLSPRFKQVRDRIDALLRHRNETPPPPDPRFNPFRPPGTPVIAAAGPRDAQEPETAAPAASSSSDLARLQQCVATLKVSGTVEIAGRTHLVINSKPYKEGDVIQTLAQGEPVYLRVRQITRSSVKFTLRDAEMTLKY